MGTFGKLLLVGNLLLAAGVVYAATQDWTARKAIQANALKHELTLSGVPVVTPSDIPGDTDSIPLGLGSPRVETVTPKFLQDHFNGLAGDDVGGAGPAKTQLDEVTAVKAKIDAKLTGPPADQLSALCGKFTAGANNRREYVPGILTLYAESFLERDLVRRLADTKDITDQPDKVAERVKQARDLLDKKFKAVQTVDPARATAEAEQVKANTETLKKAADAARVKFEAYQAAYKAAVQDTGKPAQDALAAATADATAAATDLSAAQAALDATFTGLGSDASRDETDRARRVATLLVYAGESAAWQKRAATVIGLRAYSRALTDQATRLSRMTSSGQQQITLDQGRFTDEYTMLRELAAGQAVLLNQQVGVRIAKEAERNKANERTSERRRKLAEYRVDLARIRGEVDAALAAQAAVESKLLDTQKQVSDTLQKNADLEAALAAAESKAK